MPERSTGMQRFMQEVTAELKREGTQGSMEFASALFNGHAFVPYGPGQYTPSEDLAKEPPVQEQERESEGMEM